MPQPSIRRKIHSGNSFFPSSSPGVDHNLVRKWLGLPPGPWPPDHYTLLGLTPGRTDSVAIEPLVLDRMDQLRRHQLLQPELVTEGMNRLAQALITLTDPLEKTAYDAELGFTSTDTQSTQLPPAQLKSANTTHRVDPIVIAQPMIDEFEAESVPVGISVSPDETEVIEIPSFEVLLENPVGGTLVVSDAESLHEPVEQASRVSVQLVEAVAVTPDRPRALDTAARRWIYSRLALIRKAISSWERLRPIAMDPDNPIATPGSVLNLLDATGAIRSSLHKLRGVLGEAGHPGHLTIRLINRPLVLDAVRALLRDQRQVISEDWQAGLHELHTEYARLRQKSREGRSELKGLSQSVKLIRWLRDNPEWFLVLLAAVVLVLARGR